MWTKSEHCRVTENRGESEKSTQRRKEFGKRDAREARTQGPEQLSRHAKNSKVSSTDKTENKRLGKRETERGRSGFDRTPLVLLNDAHRGAFGNARGHKRNAGEGVPDGLPMPPLGP
jgi:hypothetical protein